MEFKIIKYASKRYDVNLYNIFDSNHMFQGYVNRESSTIFVITLNAIGRLINIHMMPTEGIKEFKRNIKRSLMFGVVDRSDSMIVVYNHIHNVENLEDQCIQFVHEIVKDSQSVGVPIKGCYQHIGRNFKEV